MRAMSRTIYQAPRPLELQLVQNWWQECQIHCGPMLGRLMIQNCHHALAAPYEQLCGHR